MHTASYWVARTLQSGGAGHLPANARDQSLNLLNCQGRRLGLRESRGLSKDKGHLSCHPKKGRKSVSMTRESWQARSCHWHTRGQRPGFPAPSGFPHCGPSTHTHTITLGGLQHASACLVSFNLEAILQRIMNKGRGA